MATLCLGCSVNLEPETTTSSKPVEVPTLPACRPWTDRVSALEGRLIPIESSDGSSLWLAARAELGGQFTTTLFSGGDPGNCLNGADVVAAVPALDLSPLGVGLSGRPLGSVTSDSTYLFFSADHVDDFGSVGYGIARWDTQQSRFVALGLLWTADRPSYGSAAVVDGEWLYVFGGIKARYLAADVYLARAPIAMMATPAAYEYWAGGGHWAPLADQAMPLVDGGTMPSVSYDVAHRRWLLAYATPLATEMSIRSGLGVTGPWSAPTTLGRCDLPADDPQAFCGDIVLTRRSPNQGELLLTQGVERFERSTGALTDDWTRVVRAPWPRELP